ncbi:CorA family divalent cation transporter [Streptomyces sp. NPDC090022]|uniref:CorA family divalent cation transporter n=1 Tax=Streptomyces sp. NPDC090022 TaxID=3365920 RepID=UPI003805849A
MTNAAMSANHDDTLMPVETVAEHVEKVNLLREINAELRELNKEMEDIREITEDQLTVTVETRRVSAWTAIAVVPGALASIYGSNFEHMPELQFKYGWPIFLAVLASTAVATYVTVKRKGWL